MNPVISNSSLARSAARIALGACRTWDVDSEKWPRRGQFLLDLPAHSPAMGQKDGEKWTAAAASQPKLPKSDRLLACCGLTLHPQQAAR